MKTVKTQTLLKKNLYGFTLIELIVVITILVILGAIAFTSLTGYSGNARDSDRVTTLKNIEFGLDLHQIKSGSYPTPENQTGTGTINGNILATVGEIGEGISRIIKINKTPLDPLSKTNYVYGTNSTKSQYQIAVTLENAIAYDNSRLSPALSFGGEGVLISTTYAANSSLQARVNGNYSGYIKYSSGAETWIANIPSLLFNNTGSTDLLGTSTFFVVDKQPNLPYKIDEKTITQNKTPNEIIQAITGTGTATLTGVNITGITTSTGVSNTFTPELLASFGGNIAIIETAVLGKTTNITPPAPNDCTLDGQTITHGQNITAYTGTTVPFGSTCSGIQRTCTNGVLSGDVLHTSATCTVTTGVNCTATTYSGATITALNHTISQNFTKSITNGTGDVTATCTNGSITYGSINTICASNYVASGVWNCALDNCTGTAPANSQTNGTQGTASWTYDTVPGTCHFQCQAGYYWNSTACIASEIGYFVATAGGNKQACAIGTYQSSTGQTSCSIPISGYYTSPTNGGTANTTQTQCEANNWCSGGVKTACTGGATSPVGSTNVSACIVPCTHGSQVFNYTSTNQSWNVPAGCTQITVKAWGAGGAGSAGYYGDSYGGGGGYSTTTVSVTPGEIITVIVGGGGAAYPNATTGAYGGGGTSPNGITYQGGGGGGGRSAIRRVSTELVTAGGGGGGGTPSAYIGTGGAGGGAVGANGGHNINNYGLGGTQSAGGAGGTNGGGAGLQFQGGAGGGNTNYAGGGGGGGYYGGGGAGGDNGNGGGGGGGGSGYVPSGTTTAGFSTTPGNNGDTDYPGSPIGVGRGGSTNGGNGFIKITW
ncbi:MAG: glycine-rich protein [Candidatus Gracilibacteria bacterium]|nr:glycine-rich protein [Candidatus Gracilibacteria bacterium]